MDAASMQRGCVDIALMWGHQGAPHVSVASHPVVPTRHLSCVGQSWPVQRRHHFGTEEEVGGGGQFWAGCGQVVAGLVPWTGSSNGTFFLFFLHVYLLKLIWARELQSPCTALPPPRYFLHAFAIWTYTYNTLAQCVLTALFHHESIISTELLWIKWSTINEMTPRIMGYLFCFQQLSKSEYKS